MGKCPRRRIPKKERGEKPLQSLFSMGKEGKEGQAAKPTNTLRDKRENSTPSNRKTDICGASVEKKALRTGGKGLVKRVSWPKKKVNTSTGARKERGTKAGRGFKKKRTLEPRWS